MKRAILVLLVFFFAGSQQLSAKRLSMGKTEQIKVVHELPDTEDYMTNPGRFVDLGILYETFTIGGNIPLWVTKDPVLVGVENHNTDFYLELDKPTADALIAEHKLNKEQLLHLSFWDKYAGWVYAAIVLLIIFLYNLFFGAKDEDIIEVVDDKPKS